MSMDFDREELIQIFLIESEENISSMEEAIPIVAEDVGGSYGRKLIFHTDTGLALVRLIKKQ